MASKVEPLSAERQKMMPALTKLQKKLCDSLQDGLPICRRPYAEIAKSLNSSERMVLQSVGRLRDMQIIRRIGALINYNALGKTGTLVTAHIAQENLRGVVEAVNSLAGVSHNYLRDHYYNLWFTLQAGSYREIKVLLADLSKRFGIKFYSLPAKRAFKLDVRFCSKRNGRLPGNGNNIPRDKVVKLTCDEKYIILKLQGNLKCVAQPFNFLCRKASLSGCSENLRIEDVLKIIKNLISKGVIRRIAAIVDHHRLGFVANVLFAAEVKSERIERVGRKLARLGMVSHCYRRKTFEGWPYSLLAMMHSQSMRQLRQVVNNFTKTENITSFELLPTIVELKRQPVRQDF
jgi:DNA-binding Lrp family transcriptional regulator